jgi:hypothetical protein
MLKTLLARLFVAVVVAAGLGGTAAAQSLNAQAPTPLAPGLNQGTIDNMVGPQYWSFRYHKGQGTLHIGFTSMGLFGNPQTTTVRFILRTPSGQVVAQYPVTSSGQMAELNMPGNFPGSGTYVIEVAPTGMALVRGGGDYTISLAGPAIDYAGAAPAGPERIVGTYSVMVCPPDFDCQASLSIHFAPDGTVQTTDGHSGTWRVFDPASMIYTVVVGGDRWSLKLVPGRGLFGTNDLSVPIFQAVR